MAVQRHGIGQGQGARRSNDAVGPNTQLGNLRHDGAGVHADTVDQPQQTAIGRQRRGLGGRGALQAAGAITETEKRATTIDRRTRRVDFQVIRADRLIGRRVPHAQWAGMARFVG